ncbi:MAG TPA: hypothetical protein VFZ66_15380 [Herpetosiphonaceae bacterium]
MRAADRKGLLSWWQTTHAGIVAVQETKIHPDQASAALREPPG